MLCDYHVAYFDYLQHELSLLPAFTFLQIMKAITIIRNVVPIIHSIDAKFKINVVPDFVGL